MPSTLAAPPRRSPVTARPLRPGSRARSLSRRRTWTLGLLASGLSLTLGLAGLEVVARWAHLGADQLHQTDAQLGWGLVPGAQGWFENPRDGGGRWITINSAGYRDREFSAAKPADARRLLLLGDSYCEALQVELAEGFPDRLEGTLTTHAGRPVEVINTGVSGYGTDNALWCYRHRGRELDPELVVLAFFMNDFEDNSRRLQARNGAVEEQPYFTLEAGRLREHPAPPRSLGTKLNLALRRHWRTYRLVSHRLEWLATDRAAEAAFGGLPGLFPVHLAAADPDLEAAWDLTRALIRQLRREVEADGRRFALVALTASWQVHPEHLARFQADYPAISQHEWDWEKPNRRLREFAAAEGIACLDLLPAFQARAAQGGPELHFCGGHWTPAGHALASEEIAGFLGAEFAEVWTEDTVPAALTAAR